jgi:DNA modification methylase
MPDMSRVRQPYKNPDDIRVAALMDSGSKGTDLYDWFEDIQQVKNVSEEKTAHPCPVPVALMERIITLCAKPGDIIYDPFMGSGTTAIAAIRCGHEWIGTEIDPEYVKIAEKRISLETAQLKFV